MSLICGFCVEQGKARPDTAHLYWWAIGILLKREDREGVSTVAGCAGGPVRSSGEGAVMGLERRGRVVRDFVHSTNRMSSPGGVGWVG